jgi:hypothetical protein
MSSLPRSFTIECELGRDEYYLIPSADLIEEACKTQGIYEFGVENKSWYGNVSFAQAIARTHTGDSALVAPSNALISQLEDQVVHTKKWRNVDDVVGAITNVPAFLAGVPQCMRRRQRTMRDDAPVVIFMDLTSSAGIKAEDLLARGTAILAFARMLSDHRTVELWGGISLGEDYYGARYTGTEEKAWSNTVGWRIDTAPLDLARAAFLLASPAIARGIGYALGGATSTKGRWNGSWPFGNHSAHVRTQEERLRRALGNSEVLLVPSIYLNDPLVRDPVGWIKRELSRYTISDEDNSNSD